MTTGKKLYPVDVGFLPLQTMDFNITLQPIISDWSFVGLQGQVQLYRVGVLCRLQSTREKENDVSNRLAGCACLTCLRRWLWDQVLMMARFSFVYFYFIFSATSL